MNEDVPHLNSQQKMERLLKAIEQTFKGSKRVYHSPEDEPVVNKVVPIKPKDDFGF
tara:strand:- start:63 stop:230 length:168 start_codon:yes stop_codon:yes gene_type:complete